MGGQHVRIGSRGTSGVIVIVVALFATLITATPASATTIVGVKDINPGADGSFFFNAFFTNVNGTLFFLANDGVNGSELWKSDGTAAGTVLVKDILPGAPSAFAGFAVSLANVNGALFFNADDGVNGNELWKSDGTTAGTVMVKDINPGPDFSEPIDFVDIGGTLFFSAYDNTNGRELWKSDGTAAGTVMVKDIQPGGGTCCIDSLANVNGTLFFMANDSVNGTELWKSDGTAAGTVMVKDMNPGPVSSFGEDLTDVNGTLFFDGYDSTHGSELWKSDGTPAGTVLVSDIFPGSSGSALRFLTNVNGTLFFRAQNGTDGPELWKSDGTSAGTVMVKNINPLVGSQPSDLANVNGTLFFAANDGANGTEFWKSDGTSAGTVMVKDIYPGTSAGPPTPFGSFPSSFTRVNGTTFFSAVDPAAGTELWETDGTAAGTVLVGDIRPGVGFGSFPRYLTNVGGTLFFGADDGTHGSELWRTEEGSSGPLGGVTGRVLGNGTALAGAFVQVCPVAGGFCSTGLAGADGRYTVSGLVTGDYTVNAWAPSGTPYLPGGLPAAVHVDEGAVDPVLAVSDILLVGPTPIPTGTEIENRKIVNGVPSVYYLDDLDLATNGCPGGTASYTVTSYGVVIRSGAMVESPAGHYAAVIPAFFPNFGLARVAITIDCPSGPDQSIVFDIYIDPSGTVRDQHADPIEGATVTLYRSDAIAGPFAVVPDGSGIMSPTNRDNPDTTDAVGHFGWDVVAGFYKVRAEATGCHAPGAPGTAFVDTAVLTIPPPVTDLVLTLECEDGGEDTTPPVVTVGTDPLTLEGDTSGGFDSAHLTPAVADVTAHDAVDGDLTPTSNATGVLPLGDTTVTWSATDAADNTGTATQTVHVVDTTAPSITCPANVNRIVGHSVSLGTATATDVVDPTPTIANDAPATFGPGTTTVHWTATDDSSNLGTCNQQVTLTYRWNGFFSPVSNTATNRVNAGAVIVFKWRLQTFSFAYVTNTSVVVSNAFSGPKPPDATFSLRYDSTANQFVLNAKTPRAWRGTTRTFTLTLNDGTTHTATFRFV